MKDFVVLGKGGDAGIFWLAASDRHRRPICGAVLRRSVMPFRLVHRYGNPSQWMFRIQPSLTVAQALHDARNCLDSGQGGDFLIETDDGRIVLDDIEVADREGSTWSVG